MLQTLLADRLKLAIHHEAKEFPVYALTIAKNGPKLQEAKPGDTYVNAFPYADKFADGTELAGKIFLVGGGGPGGQTPRRYTGSELRCLPWRKQLTVIGGPDRAGQNWAYGQL